MIRSIVALAGTTLAALLLGAPTAAATPPTWSVCGPHSLEDKEVRTYLRGAVAAGPPAGTTTLTCGNRYFGWQRLAAEWEPRLGAGWEAALDGAVARTLAAPGAAVYDPRSNTWTYASPGTGVLVVIRPDDGPVVAAHPAPR